jgi:hypothetical protein
VGDFDPAPDTFETLKGNDRDEPLVAPVTTQAVVLDATDRFSAWSGLGTRDQNGDTDVALWPKRSACAIPDPPDTGYPGSGPGQTVGVTEDGRTLLVAGGEGKDVTAGALVVDLGTGIGMPVSGGLRTHRAGGTATSFGPGLLVAGGYAPNSMDPLGSAEVFDAAARRFEPDRILLERPRAHHGAVTLASGETLLVGGVGADRKLIRTLEAIAPETREYRIDKLTELEWPRKDPIVLRLSDGSVFVAGGTDGADPGSPVDSLEWLSADGARTVQKTLALSDPSGPLTVRRAFVAMPGGSVLVAGGCELRAAASEDEKTACSAACGANAGCPSRKVEWITKEGDATTLSDELDVDAPNPVLVAGSEGRPWLICDAPGTPEARTRASAVRQFDPFLGRFVEHTDGAPAPSGGATHFVRADAGLFVWLDGDVDATRSALSGFRHGARSAFASNVSPLISIDVAGVALDRPLGGVFDPDNHTVTLSEAGATLVVTDTTYTDVHLAIAVVEGAPPVVRLGSSTYGAADCAWPKATGPGQYTARVDRTGDRVAITVGRSTRDCRGPTGRVSVELGAGSGEVKIGSVTVNRSRAP